MPFQSLESTSKIHMLIRTMKFCPMHRFHLLFIKRVCDVHFLLNIKLYNVRTSWTSLCAEQPISILLLKNARRDENSLLLRNEDFHIQFLHQVSISFLPISEISVEVRRFNFLRRVDSRTLNRVAIIKIRL